MKSITHVPICKTFLACRRISKDSKSKETSVEGLRSHFHNLRFPAAVTTRLFVQLKSAHGEYKLEIQLQTDGGEVVWREPPHNVSLPEPLMVYEIPMSASLVFPGPGRYAIVLLANGEEIGRDPCIATLVDQAVGKG
jgi:hypothetical protein